MTRRLRFRWEGDLPRVGHFLKAPRGRTAYEIAAITVTHSEAGRHAGTMRVVRWDPREVPEGATVYVWCWDRRARRRR